MFFFFLFKLIIRFCRNRTIQRAATCKNENHLLALHAVIFLSFRLNLFKKNSNNNSRETKMNISRFSRSTSSQYHFRTRSFCRRRSKTSGPWLGIVKMPVSRSSAMSSRVISFRPGRPPPCHIATPPPPLCADTTIITITRATRVLCALQNTRITYTHTPAPLCLGLPNLRSPGKWADTKGLGTRDCR